MIATMTTKTDPVKVLAGGVMPLGLSALECPLKRLSNPSAAIFLLYLWTFQMDTVAVGNHM